MKLLFVLLVAFCFTANARSRNISTKPRDVKKLCNDILRENQDVVASGKATCEQFAFTKITQGQEQKFSCDTGDISIRYADIPASRGLRGYKACTTEKAKKWRDGKTVSSLIKTIHTPFATMRVDQVEGTVSLELANGQKVSYRYENGALDAREPELHRPGKLKMPLKSLSGDDIKKLLAGHKIKFKELGQLRPASNEEQFGIFTDEDQSPQTAAAGR